MKRALAFLSVFPFFAVVFGMEKDFVLRSNSFDNEGKIPSEFTKARGGKNTSPELHWKGAPKETKSFVITCVDIHPIARRWMHWAILNIPVSAVEIPFGASLKMMPSGSVELENSFGGKGYGGPQPPSGSGRHSYVFTIYALNTEKLQPSAEFMSESDLTKLMKGRVLGSARLVGFFEEP